MRPQVFFINLYYTFLYFEYFEPYLVTTQVGYLCADVL